jgi:hypothetical protein
MMAKLIPCREPIPQLPKYKKPRAPAVAYENHQLFGFDTETTRDGTKSLRSYQAVWDDEEGNSYGLLLYLDGWYAVSRLRALDASLRTLQPRYVATVSKSFATVKKLRQAVQRAHEELLYDGAPRTVMTPRSKRWRRSRRKVVRCACAFNGNFDYGAMADYTELKQEMVSGSMIGPGVRFVFRSGDVEDDDSMKGLRIECLYLGARSVPFTMKRGELWDIAPCAMELWDARTLKQCGEHIKIPKLDPDFNCPVYAMVDSIVTLKSAQRLTADLKGMGFAGAPDRFISGATVSKDVMSRFYKPFYLSAEHHELIWPAYFGGMTGPTKPDHAHDVVDNVLYGDLDGAYNASGQNLKVFDWDGSRDVSPTECQHIIEVVRGNPSEYWKYGSLHIRVRGNFDCCPIRVATVGGDNDANPTASSGLVWARMRRYTTTLTLGDYLHSQPKKHKILGGVMATQTKNRGACIFKMTADERKKHKSGTIGNQWWKLAGNAAYGVLANRNGKERDIPGPFFNALMASSITAAIRHCIWIVNDAAGDESFYNDTDSAMVTKNGFKRAVKALKPLNIGFSNKTDDELKGCNMARVAVIHGSKRYAMLGPNGEFGAKCHGLGSWWAFVDGRVRSLAHHKPLLRAVWATAYPEQFGDPDPKYARVRVFHKFSIRTERVSELVRRYAQRQWKLPLKALGAYGRAGNFGFISPAIEDGKIVPKVAYEVEEAERYSDLDLEDVAMLWSGSWDKKYDYSKLERWRFTGSDVRTVDAVAHTQLLLQSQQDTLKDDISISEVAVDVD